MDSEHNPPKQAVDANVGRKDWKPGYLKWGIFTLLAVLSLSILRSWYPFALVQPSGGLLDEHLLKDVEQCTASVPQVASPPVPFNLWRSLTIEEARDIKIWLHAPSRGLNLTQGDIADITDNFIYLIEVFRPPKAQSLAYLSSPATLSKPDEYARVTIHHGAAPEPTVKDYLVGPLPLGANTRMTELKDIYHRNIPYNARGFHRTKVELTPLIRDYMPGIAEITQELFGGVALGLANDTLIAGGASPFGFDGSFRRIWIIWRRNTPGAWLHPVNFFQYVDASGTDVSKWKILKVVYNHQIFPSMDSFVEAFHNGTLKRGPHRPDQSDDLSWSMRKPVGPRIDLDHLPGPRSVSFAGLRFRVDHKLQYVSWMGWGLYLGFDRDMGLSLWDIRFRGERVIYELSPQEALSQYAGNDPFQTSTAWLDRYIGMGAAARDLLPGYDCPYEAVFIPATVHTSLGSTTRKRAICVFEHDTGRPLTRHTGYVDGEFGAVRGYVLTLRSVNTLGKALEVMTTFDYMFYMDGTIEVRLSASGYLQGGFWEPLQEGYGAKVRETTMGSLHDHVINFKVDLDIVGLENSLLHTSTKQEEVQHPWFDDEWGSTVIQQKITREFITNEDDALLKYPSNFQGGYAIVNQAEKNRWGFPRGYAIHAGFSPIHNTVVGSKRLLRNADWARYNLAVSKRKDTEPSSSSMWNAQLPGDPVVDFHRFFDSENITQEDLVAWVNVGMHHLTQAEDVPNTRTITAASSFFLTPLNYFDYDVSIDSTNAILLSSPERVGGPFKYNDYGVGPKNCMPPAPPSFEYSDMEVFGADGKLKEALDIEEMRKQADSFLRIKLEL